MADDDSAPLFFKPLAEQERIFWQGQEDPEMLLKEKQPTQPKKEY